jgi:uncharacterized membrane protein
MRYFTRFRRRIRRASLRLDLVVGIYRRRFTARLRRQGKRLYLVASAALLILLCSVAGTVIFRHRFDLKIAAELLSVSGTLSQLGIAVGAAMLGVIGIVVSLSIFSIQQVADRGTFLTIREFANDWILRSVFWSLATFTVFAMATALLKKDFALHSLVSNFAILIAAILLLKVYFNQAIKFSDPHFTVSKIADRARRFMRKIRQIERGAEAEIRYARRKGHS